MNIKSLIMLIFCVACYACDDETQPSTEVGDVVLRRGGEEAINVDTGGDNDIAGNTMAGAEVNAGDTVMGGNMPSVCNNEPRFSSFGPYTVGFKQIDQGDDKIAIWYPAPQGSQDGAVPINYDLREWLPADVASNIPDNGAPRFEMEAFEDLPVAEGSFPVVLFAHGLAGYRLQSSQLMSHLASWGFIVTSAENTGIHLPVILGGGVPSGDRGPELMRQTIELLPTWNEAGGLLEGAIDLSRVGAMGHSMGTATVVAVAADEIVDVWVALAGAGFGAGPQKPFMIIGGTTDQLAAPPQVQSAYEAQSAPINRKVMVEGAGHLAFSDICLISREEGGLIAVASMYGLEVPMLIQMLAQDGCRPSDLPPEEAWPVIHHFVTAHLKESLSNDGDSIDFSEDTLSCFGDKINDYQERTGDMPIGGTEVPGGMEIMGGTEISGGDDMLGGTEVPGDMNTQTPGIENEVGCGGMSCDLSTNICCVGLTGQTCEVGDSCPLGSAPQACDGPEDCSGQRCCVSFPAGASCADECTGFGSEELCHLDSECSGTQLCLTCQYPGNSSITICTEPGVNPPGSMSCEDRTEAIAGTDMAGAEMAGTEMAGAEMAGAEMAGAEMAGTEMAGTEMAGTEMAGTETLPMGQLGVTEDGVVACGNASCDLSANSCCVGFFGVNCEPGVNSCILSVLQTCDGPEECNGESCCVTAGLPANYECNNDCSGAVICHEDSDCAGGEVCSLCTYPYGPVAVCHLPGELALGSFSCE